MSRAGGGSKASRKFFLAPALTFFRSTTTIFGLGLIIYHHKYGCCLKRQLLSADDSKKAREKVKFWHQLLSVNRRCPWFMFPGKEKTPPPHFFNYFMSPMIQNLKKLTFLSAWEKLPTRLHRINNHMLAAGCLS